MAEFASDTAVAFAPQVAEGTFNATLDAIAGTLNDSQGLLLGDSQSGEGGSGLDFSLDRVLRDKGSVSGGFTRPVSDFLRLEPDFTFVVPFCGNRASPGGAPVDADATPLTGIDALLQGAGLVGAAWGSGVGWRYVFGSPNPISALVYYSGNRLELLDCRCNLTLDFPPGSIPLLTAKVSVGSVKEHSEANLPTLTYGNQATVSAPVVESLGFAWGGTRGGESLSVELATSIDETPDFNKPSGVRKSISDRTVDVAALLFADNATNRIFDYTQLVATLDATLSQLSFQVGANMTTGNPARALQILMPKLELQKSSVRKRDGKFATEIAARARHTSVNAEFELIFR